MVYFVVSHASGDDDMFARRFHDDLAVAVGNRIGSESRSKIAYYDDAGPDGERWPADARVAITTGQTLIALLSQRYLRDERCGRSWAVFAERIRLHEQSTGRRYQAFIPVVWNSHGISESVLEMYGIEAPPHRTPGGEDLRVLIRLQRHRADYRAFLASLSHRVVETARAERLPASPPGTDLATAPNAFATGRPQAHPGYEKRVILVVVAGTKEQMQTVRCDLKFYGMRREDWAPYQPTVTQPLVNRAQHLAAQRLIHSEVVAIEALGARLDKEKIHGVIVLLVDAWATRIESWRSWIAEVGQQHDAEIAVLVPLNLDDQETCAHSAELRRAVMRAFPHRAGPHDYLFRLGIDSAGAFDSDLATALAEARQRRSPGPPSDRPNVRPILGIS